MGIKPRAGDILDQALLSYLDYVRAGFADPTMLEAVFGAEIPTDVLEHWDLNREMTFRIAWKPYLYNPTPAPPPGRRAHAGPRRVGQPTTASCPPSAAMPTRGRCRTRG